MLNTVPEIKKATLTGGSVPFPSQIDCTAFDMDVNHLYTYLRKYRYDAAVSTDTDAKAVRSEELALEEYKISVTQKGVRIYASTKKGLNRALSALLAITNSDGTIPCCEICDKPDLEYRSLMVDVGRQTHPLDYVLKYIDLCWLYRMSYLQLHLSDNPGIAVPVASFPNLATEGRAYSYDEIAQILKYADERGIEIVPELDIPGHSEQFMKKYPEVFGSNGILPASEAVFDALKRVFDDLCELFPGSKYIHIGGDEAAVGNWENCSETQSYMKAHGIKNIEEMYAKYIQTITNHLIEAGKTPIVWEGFPKEYNDLIDRRVVVVSWENHYQPVTDLVDAGFTIINCSWQPLYIVTPSTSWSPEHILKNWNVYNWQHWWEKSAAHKEGGISVDPDKIKLLGAQMCAWGDFITDYTDFYKACDEELALICERLPALAQKTWNKDSDMDFEQLKSAVYIM